MATYEITAPDGNTYEVTAPDDASESDVMAYAQSNYSPQEEKTGFLADAGAMATGALDMATFGLSDEIIAGGMAALDPNKTYSDVLPEVRQAQQRIQEGSPYAYGGGQFAGAVAPAVAAAPLALTKGLGKFASKGIPQAIGTSAGVGGVQGGLYGFGSGERGAGERLKGGGITAVGGAVGGAAAGALGAYASRALKAFGGKRAAKKLAQESMEQADVATGAISGQPIVQGLGDLDDGATKLLPGARAGDVDLMRSEELARQGLLGKEIESQIREADDAFKQSVKNTMQALAGETEETSQDTLTKAIGVVKRRYTAQKTLQGKLMQARNDAISKARVYKDYTKDTLLRDLSDLKNTSDFKVNLMRDENKPISDDFKILEKLVKPKQVKSVNMQTLAAWRSGLNSYKPGTQQSALASKMKTVYDDWLESHLKHAIKDGDEDLANTIFTANQKYSEFKNKYGTNKYKGQKKVIENILLQDEMTPRAMVNTVFGKSMDGKDYTEQYVKRLLDAMPEGAKRARVADGFRAGLMQKSFEGAYDDVTDTIKIGTLKNNLIKMKKSDSFKKYLTTPEHTKVIDNLIVDLQKYQTATTDKSIVNLSGTTPMLARVMQGFGSLPIIRNVSITRGASEGLAELAKTGSRAKNRAQVEKSLAEFYKQISPLIDDNINFRIPSASVGGKTAGAIATPKKELEVTINPNREK